MTQNKRSETHLPVARLGAPSMMGVSNSKGVVDRIPPYQTFCRRSRASRLFPSPPNATEGSPSSLIQLPTVVAPTAHPVRDFVDASSPLRISPSFSATKGDDPC